MTARIKGCLWVGSFAFWVALLSRVQAQDVAPRKFEARERVTTLEIKIDLGADGDDLNEPIALDLGLGFPFWLHPVGREPGETAPFGAVPQRTTANRTVRSG